MNSKLAIIFVILNVLTPILNLTLTLYNYFLLSSDDAEKIMAKKKNSINMFYALLLLLISNFIVMIMYLSAEKAS